MYNLVLTIHLAVLIRERGFVLSSDCPILLKVGVHDWSCESHPSVTLSSLLTLEVYQNENIYQMNFKFLNGLKILTLPRLNVTSNANYGIKYQN